MRPVRKHPKKNPEEYLETRVDRRTPRGHPDAMRARDILVELKRRGGDVVRQRGSHVRVRCACGQNFSTVPDHGSADVPTGTERAIERDLEPCVHFGKRWLR